MLVLTRKPNQQLHIGNDIVITIVKVRGNTIRLGIEAPKDVRVLRSELDPKPAGGEAALEDSQASAAAPSDVQPEADADASADDAQEAARVQPQTTAPLIFEARIKQPASSKQSAAVKRSAPGGAPLKRFAATATAKRSRGVFSDRNIEDCPLCHRAPQAPAMPQPALALSLSAAGR
ncbi:MAG: carbon storage regulator [Aureliella sp.]